ncbi:NADH dehydrogenase [ubiquinone] 1 alpha subcomplex assembly factor 3 isoform X2 [Harpia harpyja]|uniref:NADH dehydrogenase [ubiquinone] 1 alpha subcomplex assembly factor 3 isoform X2 n=1 Tax=Harpia harpyja TaxID=202280 RepID=UPI0022B0B621|nr:NADH dehydrogenase [ubiquinone] 1 alpha subcomplex assembly factor 3 isoform X2 [Harpia harpyja]
MPPHPSTARHGATAGKVPSPTPGSSPVTPAVSGLWLAPAGWRRAGDVGPRPQDTPPEPPVPRHPLPPAPPSVARRGGGRGTRPPAVLRLGGLSPRWRQPPHGGARRAGGRGPGQRPCRGRSREAGEPGRARGAAPGHRRGRARGRAACGRAGAPRQRDGSAAEPRSRSLPAARPGRPAGWRGPWTGSRPLPSHLRPRSLRRSSPGRSAALRGGGDRGARGGTPRRRRGQGRSSAARRARPPTPGAPHPPCRSLPRRRFRFRSGAGRSPPRAHQAAVPASPPHTSGRRTLSADTADGAGAGVPQHHVHRGLQQPRLHHQRGPGGGTLRRPAPHHPPVECWLLQGHLA